MNKTQEPLGLILVVDDEAPIRNACSRILETAGYNVETAESGERALLHMRNHNFDFILTDLKMPGTPNGVELTALVKQKTPTTDVVIMTAVPSLETAIPTLRNGAYDYLMKPFDAELLLSVVNRCFEKRRLSRELEREKRLRQELEAAYSELQKVEKLKEAFLARISHELRTPFVSAFFAIDKIELRQPQPDSDIVALRSSLNHVWEIMENILLFSDLRSNSNVNPQSPIDWKGLLTKLCGKYESLCAEKQLSVELPMTQDSESFAGDPRLIEVAFKHLLLNAIFFSNKGGHIRISARHEADFLCLSFADEGIGIPKDKLSMIFDSFYQVADYLTREVGGLGLGLAIVRQIVESHGGHIEVTSQEGVGSTFQILFPRLLKTSTVAIRGEN